ncbi:MAG: YicC family protein [Kiritimatiellae bacterium]|jgi:uncharacterized protein (TIGR00255 family)|nr:YicC family protein [Kiritimatiellia bacterium]
MSILSMTGFGRGESVKKGYKITVELSSVNRKQFDYSVSMPRELVSCESKLQKIISRYIKRGYVKGLIVVEKASSGRGVSGGIDIAVAKKQLDEMRSLARKLNLKDDITLTSLIKMQSLIKSSSLIDNPVEIWPEVENTVVKALKKLKEMRSHEGDVLEKDMRKRITGLERIEAQIEKIAPKVPAFHKKTLEQRLKKLVEKEALIDKDALAREIAVFADRCDISEELTRLKSHFLQTEKILAKGGICGRTLDFICQEMFREINTTGSKANNAGISKRVIDFKAGLEAIREQVQNIE